MSRPLPPEVSIRSHSPYSLGPTDWQRIQGLLVQSYANAMPKRATDDIAELVSGGNLDEFMATRVDPNLLIELGRRREGQKYGRACVTLAHEGPRIVGYLHTADNVSAADDLPNWKANLERFKKMHLAPSGRWVTIGEIAVRPDLQGQHIGSAMILQALNRKYAVQRASAYVRSDNSGALEFFHKLGMEQPEDDIGANPDLIKLASTAGKITRNLMEHEDIRRVALFGGIHG